MLICNVVGARPNFMKIAPIVLEMQKQGMHQVLLHTGQHYDRQMSAVFFEELGMPTPDIYLGIGSGSHAEQTANIMIAFERVCIEKAFGLVIVGGDVNSTMACSLVAAKLTIPVAHIEAGLRSFDRSMPEEVNRVVTDHISDLLFITEESASENLRKEGIDNTKVHFVGNCMIDSLLKHVDHAIAGNPWMSFAVEPGKYALLTMHRPSNVDDTDELKKLMDNISEVSRKIPVIFPVHPRTRERINSGGIRISPSLKICEPLPYLAFLGLMAKAGFVLTDSGGIQEETTALGIPCLTIRNNTERPVTITSGTNRLVGDVNKIGQSVEEILAGKWTKGARPPLWDGKASLRIVDIIKNWAEKRPLSR